MQPEEPLPYDESQFRRVVYAKNQPQYNDLVTLVDPHGVVQSRWSFSEDERRAIVDGACLILECLTFLRPLQPVRLRIEGTYGLIEQEPQKDV